MKFGKTLPNHQVPEWSHQYVNYKNLKKLIKQIVSVQEELRRKTGQPAKNNGPSVAGWGDYSHVDNFLNDPEVKKLLASFFFVLDRDIEKVDNFYTSQFLEYDRRLRKLLTSAQFNELNASLCSQDDRPEYSSHVDPKNDFITWQAGGMFAGEPRFLPTPSDLNEDLDEALAVLIELRSRFRNLKWYAELNKRAFTKILKKLDKKVGTIQQHTYFRARISPLGICSDAELNKNLILINDTLERVSPKVRDLHYPNRAGLGSEVLEARDSGSPVDVISQLIEKDDGKGVINELISIYRSAVLIPTRTLIALLNKAAISQSFHCLDEILEIIPALGDSSDISGRNFFHHHVIALGKSFKTKNSNTEASRDSNDKNDLHMLLSNTLNLEVAAPPESNSRLIGAFGPDGVNSDDSPVSLKYILNKLPAHLRSSLLQRDNYKRTPLHYSAQYGLFEVSNILIKSLKDWGVWNKDVPIDEIGSWGDAEGMTPLHLAVIGTHPRTVRILTAYGDPEKPFSSPRLLQLATRLNSPKLLESLLSIKGFDINYVDPETHETALYIACKLNLLNAARTLLEKGADTEIPEAAFGWTPIFVAATEGFLNMVTLLLEFHAKYEIFDDSGWTPVEHAVLRGHMEVADLLAIENNPAVTHPKLNESFGEDGTNFTSSIRPSTPSKDLRSESPEKTLYKNGTFSHSSVEKLSEPSAISSKKKLIRSTLINSPKATIEPSFQSSVKSFGHKFLKEDQSIILITLGSKDSREKLQPVSLNDVPLSKASSTELDTALSLVISCSDDLGGAPHVLDLPLDDTMDTINFTVPFKNDSAHILYFDVVPTYGYHVSYSSNSSKSSLDNVGGVGSAHNVSNSHDVYQKGPVRTKPPVLGRAVALLHKASASVGRNRRALSNTVTVPIVEGETLSVLGTVSFEFMVVTPFSHPKMSDERTTTYWKSLVSTRVIGHRGLGKNMLANKSLQLGENTVESFIAAASLGASYVEFDVQLTKDNIPVVYHDFLVAESGADIPMHELTLEQFLDLNNADKHHHLNGSDSSQKPHSLDDVDAAAIQRSLSTISAEGGRGRNKHLWNGIPLSKHYEDRMRLTRTFKKNNYKGNARGHSIASSFVTLKELFKKIPQNVGFNVECKYPMLDEAQEEDIGQVAVELNHWCDTVLKVVYDNAKGRDIIFSSFHPDICVMLSLKQPSIPILFLTEGGTQKMADPRAASLQNAIRFARSWNLLGIVSAAKPIVRAPRLAQIVKSNGLVCVTYGVDNNDPEVAKIEMDAGVDAVIVDSVLAVRRGLTKYASPA
ncbi:LAMI_0E08504g1_1 [Lachancea mirantina]|uniref:LAMI_0E08504g1_1 n=1 Tax=Lachancea mirantina TaxID=1230905 RepID=A0A1G4JNJ0_9SACH|nr:LAMI_0E08504g1_1 [Lachancea mirantina]